ncbi:MAG: radical SAM protein [Isosphaeraceae bacterium]
MAKEKPANTEAAKYWEGLDPRDFSPVMFQEHVVKSGLDPQAARSWLARIVHKVDFEPPSWNKFSKLPMVVCNAVGELTRLRLDTMDVSPIDNFQKLRLITHDQKAIETVLIPLEKPGAVSVCLSSQVGCAWGCVFCATARMPSRRNLATWEIIDQMAHAFEITRRQGRRITGAVFMGMGEPLANYTRVMDAAELLSCSHGGMIKSDSMTISTVGVVPEIHRFIDERRRFRLSISLGSAIDEKRAKLVPVAARWPVLELMEAARRYALTYRHRVNLAYVCLADENMGEDDIMALRDIVGDTPIRLDLIEVTDFTGNYRRPTIDELVHFRRRLMEELRQPVVRRYSGGADIAAACGTLAGGFNAV